MDKILVPLDGKSTAERELELAGQLLSDGGTLILLRVPVVHDVATGEAMLDNTAVSPIQLAQATATAETYLADVAAHTPHPCRIVVETGDTREVIAHVADREQVQMTLMATEGRARFGQWLLGGVAEQVVRRARCPILLLRQEEMAIQHIAVALDGSPFAEQVLPLVMTIARATGAQVTFLRVVRDDGHTAVSSATAYLERATAVWQDHSQLTQPIQNSVLIGSPPATIIMDYLTTHQADLLALATHGMTGTLAGMYGSVAEKLVRNVDTSMLILRPADG